MDEKELISVVVVTYNSENTILDALHSISSQSHSNIEIIVSDDCSQDRTLDIVKEYARCHTNVFVVPGFENKGVPANLNKGIQYAHGKYLKMLAGDDLLEENAIEVFCKYYRENELAISDVFAFGDVPENAIQQLKYYYQSKQWFYELSEKQQFYTLIKMNPIFAPGHGLISKELLERVNFYSEEFRYLEDYPFFLKLSKEGIRFVFLPQKLVRYRVSENSLSGSVNSKSFKSAKTFFFRIRVPLMIKEGFLIQFVKEIVYFIKCDLLLLMRRK